MERYRDPIDRAGVIVFGINLPVVVEEEKTKKEKEEIATRLLRIQGKVLDQLDKKYASRNGIESFVTRLVAQTLPGFPENVIVQSVIKQVESRYESLSNDAVVQPIEKGWYNWSEQDFTALNVLI